MTISMYNNRMKPGGLPLLFLTVFVFGVLLSLRKLFAIWPGAGTAGGDEIGCSINRGFRIISQFRVSIFPHLFTIPFPRSFGELEESTVV